MTKVNFSQADDPKLERAAELARASFKYFWREMVWEGQRIIPGLELAAVKVPFSDSGKDAPETEFLWMNELTFDGEALSGTVLNQPLALESVSAGDARQVKPDQITDWMYVVGRKVYGAYSVQVLREGMRAGERAGHDRAWGLKFPKPPIVHVVPPDWFGRKSEGGFLGKLFGGTPVIPLSLDELEGLEHPMAVNMLEAFLDLEPGGEHVTVRDDAGLTMLHRMALAGAAPIVAVLLEHGADVAAKTNAGFTALDLAERLAWREAAEHLRAAAR